MMEITPTPVQSASQPAREARVGRRIHRAKTRPLRTQRARARTTSPPGRLPPGFELSVTRRLFDEMPTHDYLPDLISVDGATFDSQQEGGLSTRFFGIGLLLFSLVALLLIVAAGK